MPSSRAWEGSRTFGHQRPGAEFCKICVARLAVTTARLKRLPLRRRRKSLSMRDPFRKWAGGEDVMTTMVAVTIAHIGRPSELGAGDGMMFRRCLIRAAYMSRSGGLSSFEHGSSRTRVQGVLSTVVPRPIGLVDV
jgi:hypothetical protein